MAFISNRHTTCADPRCRYGGPLTLVHEHWDAMSKAIVGEESCPKCGCAMLYTRRPEKGSTPWSHMEVLFPVGVPTVSWRQADLFES